MFIKLLILFICIPVIEIYVLLRAGEIIGVAPTIAMILLTGIAGAYLARTQGHDVMIRIQQALANGEMPTEELLDAAMIFAGGLTLLTPGFCTDTLGFCLLLPPTRALIKKQVRKWMEGMIASGNVYVVYRR